jgi:glyoxylase-like metal-dependent hydrolase (beta-lactamase superfamily II)
MEIAAGTFLIDVQYQGRPNGIAACALVSDSGIALIDPGPASSVPGLRSGLTSLGATIDDVRAVLLTHIHLDHAGATGTLIRENPAIAVYVSERGARHTIDPSKLLASALRIYGEALDTLFGEVVPVAADRVHALTGGETVDLDGRRIRVEYAPGHASHHVVFLDEATGTAFAGDTMGERFAPASFVMPVTPPPDIDLELWRRTTDMLRGLQAERLMVTHFGAYSDVDRHIYEHTHRLENMARVVLESLERQETDDRRADRFAAAVEASLHAEVGPELATAYAHAGIRESWTGLARYWRKRRSQ